MLSYLTLSLRRPPPPKKPKHGTVSHFFSNLSGAKAVRKYASEYDRVKSGVDRYVQEPQLYLDDDPLELWKSRHTVSSNVSAC